MYLIWEVYEVKQPLCKIGFEMFIIAKTVYLKTLDYYYREGKVKINVEPPLFRAGA